MSSSLNLAPERFENPYGSFDLASKEFVITDVRTPRPWVNVMANESYGLVISQAGGGFSWADNCQLFRLSRWEQDLVTDSYGRFFYVQDRERPESLNSTTFQPTQGESELEEIAHGLGYTRYTRRFNGLETRHTVFVPEAGCREIWIVEIENLSGRNRSLQVGAYLEWHLGGIGDWHREFHRLFIESRPTGNTLVAWKHPGLEEHRRDPVQEPPRAYMTWSGVEGVRWITDKQAWLGRIGRVDRPAAFFDEVASSTTPRWDDPVAGSLASFNLAPGETKTIVLAIGSEPDEAGCLRAASSISEASARQELARVQESWETRCNQNIRTGDAATDLMVNSWLPYQAIAGRLWAKCAYYQQGGAFGYRDQLQDSLMELDRDPGVTLTQLGRHAEAMYDDGGVRHWWHPGTEIFVQSHHSDTSLWLAYGVLAYLDATSDLGSLEREYAYLSRPTDVPWVEKAIRRERPLVRAERGTLLDHAVRGIERALSLISPRGLPLIGAGDWNDGLSHAGIEGKGESVWMAMFLFDILNRWQPYLERLGNLELADRYAKAAESFRTAVNEHAWDGEWYLAGTRDDGKPFGSHVCEEGKILLNPQTWAVISGIAPPERAKVAMESVREHLVTPYGALLLRPAYSSVDPYIGYITRYAPALRENGGVYSHASTWAVWAFAKMGDRNTAWDIYRGMLPPLRAQEDADLYAAEPYVMPGNIDGPDSPYAGRAGWTWYTGSAAWMVRIARELGK